MIEIYIIDKYLRTNDSGANCISPPFRSNVIVSNAIADTR